MSKKEASARLKINKLLEESGWRLIEDESGDANADVEVCQNPGSRIDTQHPGEDYTAVIIISRV